MEKQIFMMIMMGYDLHPMIYVNFLNSRIMIAQV